MVFYNGVWKVAFRRPQTATLPGQTEVEMDWFTGALVCLIPIGLVAALFILAERSKSRVRRKSFKDLSVKERHDRILREDAEKDYWV